MRTLRRTAVLWLVVLMSAAAMPISHTPCAYAEIPDHPGDYLWLDIKDEPLPFQDDATILHVMRTATLVGAGVGGPYQPGTLKLVLDHRNIRFHVLFRTIEDTTRIPPSGDSRQSGIRYRDAAIFESAAYELSEMLGIGRVPPATERRFDDQVGTVQIFMEGTLSEAELDKRGKLNPPDLDRWNLQQQILLAFDSLIANVDRTQDDVMIDGDWNLWFIDHTSAFRPVSKLLHKKLLKACERGLWTSLQEVGEDEISERLEPYLTEREISELLRRRTKLIRHFEKLVAKHGEDAVIFDLD